MSSHRRRVHVRALLLGVIGWLGACVPALADSPHSLPGFGYVSPAPGTALHLPQTNVIVRPGGLVDPSSLLPTTIQTTGSASGEHTGLLRLAEDGRTILFRPWIAFQPGEEVTCRIAEGIRTADGSLPATTLPAAEFTFTISPGAPPPGPALAGLRDEIPLEAARIGIRPQSEPGLAPRSLGAAADSHLSDPPAIQGSVTGSPAAGRLFLSDISFDDVTYKSHLIIAESDGTPVFYRKLNGSGFDFKVQRGRWLSYYDASKAAFYLLNARYALIDSFRCGNGYYTDLHELILLPNGHALVMAYDPQIVDMSGIVEGGHPDAEVVGLIIQELDRDKEVVFQWRSWDHFQITDITSRPLTAPRIDYSHGNAIEPDFDGHLLISSRHMDEITKIDRNTGAIVWRLGGKNNQFTFTNDPERFSQQHAIRRLANGHVTLFDNGNYHAVPHSRAVEYALDEENKIATLVWEYRNTPDTYGFAMGSVQRLPNGNTLVSWGSANPTATEVTPGGQKVAEIDLPPTIYSYRSFRHEWPPVLPAPVTTRPWRINLADGDWIPVSIEPEAFEADSIDVATVRLEGIVPADSHVERGDFDGDGRRELRLRFSREAAAPHYAPGSRQLAVVGELTSGERFHGTADARIVGGRDRSMRVLSPPGRFPVELALGAATGTRMVTIAVYDLRGRLVNRWRAQTDAQDRVLWNGRGFGGARLTAGLYFLRTEGTSLVETAKVALVR